MLCYLQSRHRNYKILKVNFLERLKRANIQNYEQEYKWLVCEALNISSTEFYLKNNDFTQEELEKINILISRRENNEPLQYIFGEADFYGREFYVGKGVLIPRNDTETLINAALKLTPKDSQIKFLDWGTGSGCIGITLLLERENSFAYLLEKNQDAIFYAKKNISRYKLEERVKFSLPDEKIDLLISNPPYIPSNEIAGLMPEVKNYEPHSALDGGIDGMKFYRKIFSEAKNILKSGGFLILEMGNNFQVEYLRNFSNEFKFIESFFDNGNFLRCMVWRFS